MLYLDWLSLVYSLLLPMYGDLRTVFLPARIDIAFPVFVCWRSFCYTEPET
jgi:hypothetical protein